MNTYPLLTAVQLSVTFTALDGVTPINPTNVALEVRPPEGDIRSYVKTDFANPSTGVFTFVISVDQSGPWIYNWQGSGNVEVATGDQYLNVSQSATLAG